MADKLLMHNPERKKYSKGVRADGGCYFCGEEMKGQFHIAKYKEWVVIANKYPFIDYAILAIPKRHVEFVTALHKSEWNELKIVIDDLLNAWRKYYLWEHKRSANEQVLDNGKPSWNIISERFPKETYDVDEEMTVYINNGEHSGRTVPHLHWNIVPRIYIRRTGLEAMGYFQKVKTTPDDTAKLFKKLLKDE